MRKIIIISVLCIVVIAPILAWATVELGRIVFKDEPSSSVTKATDEELLKALRTYNDTLPDSQRFQSVDKIISSQQYSNWWYIAVVELRDSFGDLDTPVLFSKFNNTRPISVINRPGSQLDLVNTSGGQGIPYSVIDKFNEEYAKYYKLNDAHEE